MVGKALVNYSSPKEGGKGFPRSLKPQSQQKMMGPPMHRMGIKSLKEVSLVPSAGPTGGGLVTQLGSEEAAARATRAFGRRLSDDARLATLFIGQDPSDIISQEVHYKPKPYTLELPKARNPGAGPGIL